MLCSYCMNEIGQVSEKCPHCGKSTAVTVPPHMLVPGTVLCGRYIVGIAKGEGGFGITYIGKDTKLDRTVAVKEYFPSAGAGRFQKGQGKVLKRSTDSCKVHRRARHRQRYRLL